MPYYLTPNIHELRNFMNDCRQLRHLLNIFAIGVTRAIGLEQFTQFM